MTYYRPVAYHEIPDRYAAQTLAMAEAYYGAEPEYSDADWAVDNGMTPEELDRNLYPEDFVTEDDFNAATPDEWEGLQAALDWEQHSFTL